MKVTVTGPRGGAYTVDGSVNGAADVYSDDGEWRLFFAGPAPALSTRRARNLAAVDGGDAGETGKEAGRGRGEGAYTTWMLVRRCLVGSLS